MIWLRLQKLVTPYVEARATETESRLLRRVVEAEGRLSVQLETTKARVEAVNARSDEILRQIAGSQIKQTSFRNHQFFYPNHIFAGTISGEYMRASNCLARDFYHPEFAEFCRLVHGDVILHRKLWENAFVYERLKRYGALTPGNHGLVFGVGLEYMPALFASFGIDVMATDSPQEGGWAGEHSSSLEQLFFSNLIDREVFSRHVRFEACDMNAIPDHLKGFDFCWSSCALEHLGSLQHGCDFIINSVEKTLKVGGIACHTTELNLTSDVETVEHPETVLYRKSDLERLCATLTERGHIVEPLRIEPGDLLPDYLVDVPPFSGDPHLKLMLGQFVTTSVGIVVRRGR